MWPQRNNRQYDWGGKPVEPRLVDKLLPLWVIAGMSVAVALLSLVLLASIDDYRAYCRNTACKDEAAAPSPSPPPPGATAQPAP